MGDERELHGADDADDASTILGEPYARANEPAAAFAVTVIEGPDCDASFVIDGLGAGPQLVGKSPSAHFRLNDPKVSRRHASLDIEGGRLRVIDLGSTNGTFVDGVAISGAFLVGDELIRIGSTALSVARLDPSRTEPGPRRSGFGRFFGESPQMQRLYPLIERLAASDVPIVIEGETGTGKEVLAESIHEASRRARGPYVVLDCTTIAPSLAESELFGHERGSFTGAGSARPGVFELADGGSLFIDEIGDLDLSLQPKLLRALERGEIRRVGGNQSLKVDVRVIAATRRNLDLAVQDRLFRDDLFHRLAVGRIELPPLRHRRGDVVLLAQRFWRELGATRPLPATLMQRWETADWPGNVRELRNAIARQLAVGDLAHDDQPEFTSARAGDVLERLLSQELPFPIARLRLLEEFQRLYVERALAAHRGDAEAAAAASGISRRYLDMLRTGKRRR